MPRSFFACSVLICCDYDAVKLRGALGICLGLPRNIQRLQNLFKIRLLHSVTGADNARLRAVSIEIGLSVIFRQQLVGLRLRDLDIMPVLLPADLPFRM